MNEMKSKSRYFRFIPLTKLLIIIIGIALIPLVISIVKSGYLYVLDNDEFNHVQLTYLYAHGSRPYLDIYNSVYTPLFGWFLLPVFRTMGFSFATIAFTRYIMILLFAIRVVASFFIVHKIFGKRIAYLFIPMFLLDPFVVFSSMQIRPDNLMMTVYTVGLLLFTLALYKPKPASSYMAGIFLGTSLLILPKILPSIGIMLIALSVWSIIKKKYIFAGASLVGLASPFVLFAFYCLLNGSFTEMFTQAVLEAKAAYSHFPIHIPLGNFYIPDNFLVYGTMGKPLTWFYAWFLPFAACIGIFVTVMEYLKKHFIDTSGVLKLMLALSLFAQWGALFFLQVIFMQHYLPISWLYALFAAVTIDYTLTTISTYKGARATAKIALTVLAVVMILTSIRNNIHRSKMDSTNLITAFTNRWLQIPEGTYTFPNYLFRPSIFPVTYGYFIGNVPPAILNRLPNIPARIEQYQIPFLLVDEYLMSKLPVEVAAYIQNHYTRVDGDGELMTRKP